jgi:hypothetical protein
VGKEIIACRYFKPQFYLRCRVRGWLCALRFHQRHIPSTFNALTRSQECYRAGLPSEHSFAISLAPQVSKIRPRVMNPARGKRPVLSLRVAITNFSAYEIRMNLAHECRRDLAFDRFKRGCRAEWCKGQIQPNARGYQVGETASADRLVVLKPGRRRPLTFDSTG